jgi:hypothetical protein
MRPYRIEKEFGIKISKDIHHIDLIEVAPLKASLKLYAGRLHCVKMQDLPYDPSDSLSQDMAQAVATYCHNDLENTALLWAELQDQIALRYAMSQQYGINLLSKSDAQIAEAVIGNEIMRLSGVYPKTPKLAEGWTFQYKLPGFISFQTEYMRRALATVVSSVFELKSVVEDGATKTKISMPEPIAKLKIAIGASVYKFGKGGIHSTEKKTCHIADKVTLLIDRDVESYYPRIILNQKLFTTNTLLTYC